MPQGAVELLIYGGDTFTLCKGPLRYDEPTKRGVLSDNYKRSNTKESYWRVDMYNITTTTTPHIVGPWGGSSLSGSSEISRTLMRWIGGTLAGPQVRGN
jgi:hypothetical protein